MNANLKSATAPGNAAAQAARESKPTAERHNAPNEPRHSHERKVVRVRRGRPSVLLSRLLVLFCLIGLVAVQRWLAALFDDDIMGCIVASMLAITILGVIKPAAFAPDRRR